MNAVRKASIRRYESRMDARAPSKIVVSRHEALLGESEYSQCAYRAAGSFAQRSRHPQSNLKSIRTTISKQPLPCPIGEILTHQHPIRCLERVFSEKTLVISLTAVRYLSLATSPAEEVARGCKISVKYSMLVVD